MSFISEHILPGEARPYDILAGIPHGRASEALVPGCLVLEGGAFRGLYTQGFLDAMMENGLNLSCVVGVSAGALAGANYVSGQIGRSARTNLVYRHDSRYIGARSLLHSHSLLDVGFLTEDRGVLEPLDRERFDRPEQRYVAVATNCETGKATYFEKGRCSDILLAARASATMPFLSPVVMIDGAPYLDGGCACAIPYRWALDQGYEKIVVLRTRDKAYRDENRMVRRADALAESYVKRRLPGASRVYRAYPAVTETLVRREEGAVNRIYRRYPALARALNEKGSRYNAQCDELDELDRRGRLLHICPSRPIRVGRMEGDVQKLYDLYCEGRRDALAWLPALRQYLIAS
jgi:predicted patatin/cPLA2 family phospholipase